MELSELQKKIVNAQEDRIVVLAAAAAGKTTVLTERVRKMLKDGIDPIDIGVITFTNLAANELRARLGDDYKEGMYIGTIHGLANKFLRSRGINTDKLIDNDDFDGFFDLIKKYPSCVKHIRHILLDEAQDTSEAEYDFIFNMIDPVTFFVVGDLRQSIYGFKGAHPELFEALCNDPDVIVYDLNENYRNGSNILRFAKSILRETGMTDSSIPMNNGGIVYEDITDLTNLKGWLRSKDTYGDWAILCRTNDEIALIQKDLDKEGIPNVTFKQGRTTREELMDLMKANTVKVLTRHSAKGLEFNNVAVWAPVKWGGDEMCRVNYVAATRAKKILLWLREPQKKTKKKSKYF